MGVSHSMEEGQVERVSTALRNSANAIQGINAKFEVIDVHMAEVRQFNATMNNRVEATIDSMAKLETICSDRIETVVDTLGVLTDQVALGLEALTDHLESVDTEQAAIQLPKIIIPIVIPLILLLIELAISNAYLGLLLASLSEVKSRAADNVFYSRYLFGNAIAVMLGLTVGLIWLVAYRVKLWQKANQFSRRDVERTLSKSNIKKSLSNVASASHAVLRDHAVLPRALSADDDSESMGRQDSPSNRSPHVSDGTGGSPNQTSQHESTSLVSDLSPQRRSLRVSGRAEDGKISRPRSGSGGTSDGGSSFGFRETARSTAANLQEAIHERGVRRRRLEASRAEGEASPSGLEPLSLPERQVSIMSSDSHSPSDCYDRAHAELARAGQGSSSPAAESSASRPAKVVGAAGASRGKLGTEASAGKARRGGFVPHTSMGGPLAMNVAWRRRTSHSG